MNLFEIENLKIQFSKVKAVDGVSFEIKKGETFSLVGESGCGKTTTARAILGVYPIADGKVLWNGKDISTLSKTEMKAFRQQNQMIFQDPYSSLDPRMTVASIIEEGMKQHFNYGKAERHKRIIELLNTVGLTEEYASRFPHELSGGQRQRVGIARALAIDPEFIVCDEPIAALDVSIQAQIINLLIRLQKERGLTYLMISHDLTMVRHISDRIAVLYLGSIVELADTETLYKKPLHPYTQALFSAIPDPDPDSDWLKNRVKMTGEIPSPSNSPCGCKFCTRCPYADGKCKAKAPALKEVESGHFAACHKIFSS